MDKMQRKFLKNSSILKLFLCLVFVIECQAPPKKATDDSKLKFSNLLSSLKNTRGKKPSPKKRSARVVSRKTDAPWPLRALSCGSSRYQSNQNVPKRSALKKPEVQTTRIDHQVAQSGVKFAQPSARAPYCAPYPRCLDQRASFPDRVGMVPLPASTVDGDPLVDDFSRITPPFLSTELSQVPKPGGPGGDNFAERNLPPLAPQSSRSKTYWGVNPLQPGDLSFVASNFSNSFNTARDDSQEHLRSRGRGSGHNLRSPVASSLPRPVPVEAISEHDRPNLDDQRYFHSFATSLRDDSSPRDFLPQRETENSFSIKKEEPKNDLVGAPNPDQVSYLKTLFTSRGAKSVYAAASLVGLILCAVGVCKSDPDPLDDEFEQENDANTKWWFKFGGGALLVMGITAFAISTQVK